MHRLSNPGAGGSLRVATAVLIVAICCTLTVLRVVAGPLPSQIRFATFNASLFRNHPGQLAEDLRNGDAQARTIAEIVQRVRPDVLLINEFDYDPTGVAPEVFRSCYLGIGQNGATPILYPYVYVAPVNTGVPTGYDLNNNGTADDLGDLVGYGLFEGQYGMVLYSVYPIDCGAVRTFRSFLWNDMPGALLPKDPTTGAPWFDPPELDVLPLSSKSHWDIPIRVGWAVIHVLASHPTPPVFDGPEDANGRRNHDEIRFWADYIDPAWSGYIYDDTGSPGGLPAGSHFVIMGDLNADPEDGDSTDYAARQLADHPLVSSAAAITAPPWSYGGAEQAQLQGGANNSHVGDPRYDTADWSDTGSGNLRADYVLPSATLDILDAGVFWPLTTDPLFPLVGVYPFPSSDHRLVWVDVIAPPD
jgi:hypothetical protein